MPTHIAIPTPNSSFDERGDVLRVQGGSAAPFEVRVDAGIVFARFLTQEPQSWTDVTLASVLAWFDADSPIAAFLRRQGVHPLRQLLYDGVVEHAERTSAVAQ